MSEQQPEYQDQGSLDQPEQEVREWTPEEPVDRVADVSAEPTEGDPVNPVLDGTNDVEQDTKGSSDQGGGEPAGTGTV